jgi:hypothetical protein
VGLLLTRSRAVYFLKKALIALGLASLLVFLSIFPNVGYSGSAHVDRGDVVKVYELLSIYAIVKYTYNITYNPFLYPLTWLRGDGSASGSSSMITFPLSGSIFVSTVWPGLKEMEEDALMCMALSEIHLNFLMLFLVALAIELAKIRSLFICVFGGVIGFISGGLLGTIGGFFIPFFVIEFIMVRLGKESKLAKIFNSFRKD